MGTLCPHEWLISRSSQGDVSKLLILPDFVPLNLSQALVESFIDFFFENFEKLDVENFQPALTMTRKSKKLEKIFFFVQNGTFSC